MYRPETWGLLVTKPISRLLGSAGSGSRTSSDVTGRAGLEPATGGLKVLRTRPRKKPSPPSCCDPREAWQEWQGWAFVEVRWRSFALTKTLQTYEVGRSGANERA